MKRSRTPLPSFGHPIATTAALVAPVRESTLSLQRQFTALSEHILTLQAEQARHHRWGRHSQADKAWRKAQQAGFKAQLIADELQRRGTYAGLVPPMVEPMTQATRPGPDAIERAKRKGR